MAVHSPLNAFSFDISLIEIGQEIKFLEHLKKNLDHLYVYDEIWCGGVVFRRGNIANIS
jgi:hypothetical protein